MKVEKVVDSTWYLGSKRIKKTLTTRDVRARGDWHLWIYCCYWNLRLKNVSLTHNESSDKKMEEALRILNGQELIAVKIDRDSHHTLFEFDLGGTLETAPYEHLDSDGDPYDCWMLFLPDGNVVTYRADGMYHCHPADQACDKVEWLSC